MNFSINEIVDFIKTLIVPVFVSGIVSYWVSRITYKYESRHSDDVQIFANLYKNLLFLKDNFFVSAEPMVHANNYHNVPCDLWDDIKKDKRYFVVNKKINCHDKCMDNLYLDLREYNELTDKYCIKIKEIVKNKTGRDMYHNSYDKEIVKNWYNEKFLKLAGIFMDLDVKNPNVGPFAITIEEYLKDIDKSELVKLRKTIIKRLNTAIERTKKQIV